MLASFPQAYKTPPATPSHSRITVEQLVTATLPAVSQIRMFGWKNLLAFLFLTTGLAFATPTLQAQNHDLSASVEHERFKKGFSRNASRGLVNGRSGGQGGHGGNGGQGGRVPLKGKTSHHHAKRGDGSGGRGGNGGNAGPGGNGGKATYVVDLGQEHQDDGRKHHGAHGDEHRGHSTYDGYDEYGLERDRYFKEHQDEHEHNRFGDHERYRLGEYGHHHPHLCTCGGPGRDYERSRYQDIDRLRDEERDRSRDRFGDEHERERGWAKHHGEQEGDYGHGKVHPNEKAYPLGVSHGAGIANGAAGGDGGHGGNGGSGSYISKD